MRALSLLTPMKKAVVVAVKALMFDSKQSYFEYFALPIEMPVDMSLLESRYHEVLLKVHPDRFANATDQEKRIAMQYASMANEAFETLSSLVKRAIYLLELKGVEVDLENNHALSPELLIKQMELREAYEMATNDPKLKAEIFSEAEAMLADQLDLFEVYYQQGSEDSLEQAKQTCYQLVFFQRFLESMR